VRGGWDERYVAMSLIAVKVVGADNHQASVLALRPTVGLQRHACETGDFFKPRFKVCDDGAIALSLVGRCKWVKIRNFRPRERDHVRRCIKLHRTRPK